MNIYGTCTTTVAEEPCTTTVAPKMSDAASTTTRYRNDYFLFGNVNDYFLYDSRE